MPKLLARKPKRLHNVQPHRDYLKVRKEGRWYHFDVKWPDDYDDSESLLDKAIWNAMALAGIEIYCNGRTRTYDSYCNDIGDMRSGNRSRTMFYLSTCAPF